MLVNQKGETMSDEDAQERIRRTIERTGKFILSCAENPKIGEVRFYAGLPFRVVRLVSFEEACRNRCADIWGAEVGIPDPDDFSFEVEVAD